MQRPHEFMRDRKAAVLVRRLRVQPQPDRLEMLPRILAKNPMDFWIEVLVRVVDLQTACDAIRAGDKLPRLFAQRLAIPEVADHAGQCVHRLFQRLHDRRGHAQRAFQAAVEHVLHRPAELANVGRSDHAPAALERVERAANRRQRLVIFGIAQEGWEMPLQGFENLRGLFQEDIANLGIDLVRAGRLGQLDRLGCRGLRRGIGTQTLVDLRKHRIELVQQMLGLRLRLLQRFDVALSQSDRIGESVRQR